MVRVARPDAGPLGWSLTLNFARPAMHIRQNGGWQVDPKDNTKAVWDTPQALNALQWLHDRMYKDRTLAKSTDITATGVSAPVALSQGKLAMLSGHSGDIPGLLVQAPDTVGQWDVAVLPKGPVQRDAAATIDGWGVWTGSKHKEAAWELVKFLQGDQWWDLAVTIVGHQPARKSWMDRYVQLMKKASPALADKNLAAFTEATTQNYARTEQFFKRDAESKTVWSDTVAAVFTRNERPVADAFRDAARQVNAINAA
jgi:ABC-type glycerol-3-phosphate transport system substrate-binding protein